MEGPRLRGPSIPATGTDVSLRSVTRRQHFVGVDPHHEIYDLVRRDLGEPMRRVRRNDDDIAGADLAAVAVDNLAAAGTRAVERRDDGAVGRRFLHVLDRSTGHKSSVA